MKRIQIIPICLALLLSPLLSLKATASEVTSRCDLYLKFSEHGSYLWNLHETEVHTRVREALESKGYEITPDVNASQKLKISVYLGFPCYTGVTKLDRLFTPAYISFSLKNNEHTLDHSTLIHAKESVIGRRAIKSILRFIENMPSCLQEESEILK